MTTTRHQASRSKHHKSNSKDIVLVTKNGIELGALEYKGSDFPWTFGQFIEYEAFSEFKPLFDTLNNNRNKIDDLFDDFDSNKSIIDELSTESDEIEDKINKLKLYILNKSNNQIDKITTINIENQEFEYK